MVSRRPAGTASHRLLKRENRPGPACVGISSCYVRRLEESSTPGSGFFHPRFGSQCAHFQPSTITRNPGTDDPSASLPYFESGVAANNEEDSVTSETTELRNVPADKHRRTITIATFVLAVGIPIAGILTADARGVEVSPGLGDWIFVAIIAAIAASTFAFLVPWVLKGDGSRTGGLVLSGVAFVTSFVAFWTMVPLILGAAGVLVGYETRLSTADGRRRGLGLAAMVLGTIATVVSVVGTIATS